MLEHRIIYNYIFISYSKFIAGRKQIGLLLTLGVRSCSFESNLPDLIKKNNHTIVYITKLKLKKTSVILISSDEIVYYKGIYQGGVIIGSNWEE